MIPESQSETSVARSRAASLAPWQLLAVAVALLCTLSGLALGGFHSGAPPVSAAGPQMDMDEGAVRPSGLVAAEGTAGAPWSQRSQGPGEGVGEGAEAPGGPEDGPGDEPGGGTLWAPLLAKGGLSFFLAFCVGFAARAALKLLCLGVGAAALAIFGLQYAGLLGDFQWDRLASFWESGLAEVRGQVDGLRGFIAGRLPSAASGMIGMLVGFRRPS